MTFPIGSLNWVDGDDGSKTVIAFGSQVGGPRRELMATSKRGTKKETYGNDRTPEAAKPEVQTEAEACKNVVELILRLFVAPKFLIRLP